MNHRLRKALCFILVWAFVAGVIPQVTAQAAVNCKSLCGTVLKATGGSKQLKYASAAALDFGGLSSLDRKKVKSIQYVCDAKEAYSVCIIKTDNSSDAKSILNSLKKYKKNNCSSNYLSDYTATEQKVFKNAMCGKKGTWVWYIAMSPKKGVNAKGQTALKKKL